MNAERFDDPNDELNSSKYQTGKLCIVRGCGKPAGTHWSPFFCQPCNANRMRRIGAVLDHEVARHEGRVPPDSMPSIAKAKS